MKSADKWTSFTVISLSADGDVQAIEKVLKHYDAYISKASLRPLYDEYGNIYIAVDTELIGRIRTALMEMILRKKEELSMELKPTGIF